MIGQRTVGLAQIPLDRTKLVLEHNEGFERQKRSRFDDGEEHVLGRWVKTPFAISETRLA